MTLTGLWVHLQYGRFTKPKQLKSHDPSGVRSTKSFTGQLHRFLINANLTQRQTRSRKKGKQLWRGKGGGGERKYSTQHGLFVRFLPAVICTERSCTEQTVTNTDTLAHQHPHTHAQCLQTSYQVTHSLTHMWAKSPGLHEASNTHTHTPLHVNGINPHPIRLSVNRQPQAQPQESCISDKTEHRVWNCGPIFLPLGSMNFAFRPPFCFALLCSFPNAFLWSENTQRTSVAQTSLKQLQLHHLIRIIQQKRINTRSAIKSRVQERCAFFYFRSLSKPNNLNTFIILCSRSKQTPLWNVVKDDWWNLEKMCSQVI